jgi:DNA-binding transcriptional ArsR family regulator
MPDVFSALADPTRRHILDRLHREGPLSITALAASLAISRQAVTKHLDVLEGAGLVERERRGRERLHRLCADPLSAVEEWLTVYSAEWDKRLERLQSHVEKKEERER